MRTEESTQEYGFRSDSNWASPVHIHRLDGSVSRITAGQPVDGRFRGSGGGTPVTHSLRPQTVSLPTHSAKGRIATEGEQETGVGRVHPPALQGGGTPPSRPLRQHPVSPP